MRVLSLLLGPAAGLVVLVVFAGLVQAASASGASFGRSPGSHFREDHFGTRRNYRVERQSRLPRVQHQRPSRLLLPPD